MTAPSRHKPFLSDYRPAFEVVEERLGRSTCYPHTEQLPLLHRALDLEFRNALPGHVARTDRRGDGFHKIMLRTGALLFCNLFNGARQDGLQLHSLPDGDLVSRVCVVQQITEATRKGPLHRFKFYGGADFCPEIRLAGRRVLFTDHVLQRFSERVPNRLGGDLSCLLLAFYGTPLIALPVGADYAFVLPYLESLLAFPFEMREEDFVVLSCLSVNEIHSMEREAPPFTFNWHYGETFASVPRVRHWLPTKWMRDLTAKWERKTPLPPLSAAPPARLTWHFVADRLKDNETKNGHGPGSRFFFLDRIPGPNVFVTRPGQEEPQVNERDVFQQMAPDKRWDDYFDWREQAVLRGKAVAPPLGTAGQPAPAPA